MHELCSILDELRPVSRLYKDLIAYVPDRPGHDRRYAMDITKIRNELGWMPKHNIETGLRETVKWYLDHMDWVEAIMKQAGFGDWLEQNYARRGGSKGIILAGGQRHTSLPDNLGISKQILPVYNKPMIYYPLSMLMLAGIREILVISSPEDLSSFQRLLGDGEKWGVSFSYVEQSEPRGLAEAFILGKDFIGSDTACLILGDNIFFGTGLWDHLRNGAALKEGAQVFAYPVREPQHYGVIEFDSEGRALSLEEKPNRPRSNFAVPGLYFYDNRVVDFAAHLQPSPAANSRSPISTEFIWSRACFAFSNSDAALPGWMLVLTRRFYKPPTSSKPSKNGRA